MCGKRGKNTKGIIAAYLQRFDIVFPVQLVFMDIILMYINWLNRFDRPHGFEGIREDWYVKAIIERYHFSA